MNASLFQWPLQALIFVVLPIFSFQSAYADVFPIEELAEKLETSRSKNIVVWYIEAGGIAPRMKITRLRSKNGSFIDLGESYRPKENIGWVDLPKQPGFYGLALPKGLYELTEFSVPYFDLPYKYDTSTRKQFRFSVAKDTLNYGGHLFIDEERAINSVTVRLFNDYARRYQELRELIKATDVDFPLTNSPGVRDDFAKLLEQ